MARKRDRLFAAFGAGLFIISTLAVTIIVIVQANSGNPTTPPVTSKACDISVPIPSQAVAAPATYKPDGAVTKLESTDIEAGTGAAAKNGDCLVMKYQGNLATTGNIFDENYSKTQSLQFTLGQGQVIAGWDQGLVGMKVGGTRRLSIPASLGYGSQTAGSIPANSDLVFIVKLEKIK